MAGRRRKREYTAENLKGVKEIDTERTTVRIEPPQDHTLISPSLADLIIIGSAGYSEGDVRAIKPLGIVVARYSIFYGGPSGYTGDRPEETGYSLDLPKSVDTVKALLSHEPFLDALVARDDALIRTALEDLNAGLREPVLATPYLTEALQVQR
jgi:hypothetical protein